MTARVLGVLVIATASSSVVTSKTRFKIEPGPAVISREESAIAIDSTAGSEHAVILIEETEQDDDISILSKTTYHMRAKILSNEGRGLANVEIPLLTKEGSVKEWWGRTILPDGQVLESPKEDLKEQAAVRSGSGRESRLVKAVLPGVVPGAVIDYGYTVRDVNAARLRRVPLQRAWPMRSFRYRWIPWSRMTEARPRSSACTLSRAQGLHVEAAREKKWFLVTGRDLPAVVRETLAPPDDETRGTAVLYYTSYARDVDDFWDIVATEWSKLATLFCKPDRVMEHALEAMQFPAGADLETKLHLAYDWLASHVKNRSLESSEDRETLSRGDPEDEMLDGVSGVLERKEASAWQIDIVFMGMARSLGAEAHLVLACDRREHDWNPSLLALDQFDEAVVAVRLPSDPPGMVTLVDPGSGLPYGQIPYWVAGGKALLASSKGGRLVDIPRSDPRQNVSDSKATIAIDAEKDSARVTWSRSGSGQKGLVERRVLRRLIPEERGKRLDDLCGAGGGFEVLRAEAPRIEEISESFHLQCEGESERRGGGGDGSTLSLRFGGAWIEEVPTLSATSRVHPIVLPFAGTDRDTIEVPSPKGFRPAEAAEPVRIEISLGTYTLAVSAAETGYHVERSLTLSESEIPPESYDAFRRFLEEVHVADRTPLEFKRSVVKP